MLTLPTELRAAFKEPFGPVYTEAEELLADAASEERDTPLVAVGDVVTYHLVRAGREPDVALVDERTKRELVEAEIRETVTERVSVEARNPPAELTADVVETLRESLEREEPTTVLVDGEEDLVVLPAIVVAPDGASVVYGQPDEGMVHVVVDDELRAEARALLERFEGDQERFWELLEE